MKAITVIIYILGASTGYLHQLFPCETPDLDPYDPGYSCLSRSVYFCHEAITGGSIAMMWLVYKFSKPEGLFKYFQLGMLSFTVGGFIDILFRSENSIITIVAFAWFIGYCIYKYVKK